MDKLRPPEGSRIFRPLTDAMINNLWLAFIIVGVLLLCFFLSSCAPPAGNPASGEINRNIYQMMLDRAVLREMKSNGTQYTAPVGP